MNDGKRKRIARIRRHRRVRKKVVGTAECPRLGVFRSNRHIYVQLIDDEAGRVMAEASTMSRDLRDKIKADSSKTEAAKVVGAAIAERATAASVSRVVFDRGGYRFHGRIKALAEAAREKGLVF